MPEENREWEVVEEDLLTEDEVRKQRAYLHRRAHPEAINEQEKLVELPVGLSAVYFPDLGERMYPGDRLNPPTPEKTLEILNNFLMQLNEQGADIVTSVDVKVLVGGEGISGDTIQTRKIAVVRKASATPTQG